MRLGNDYSPWELEWTIVRFVGYHNQERVHAAIGNVTPDDRYHGLGREILSRRKGIKRLTLERRKQENLRNAAWPHTGARPSLRETVEASENF